MMLPVTAINATAKPTVRPTERCSQKMNLRRVIVSRVPARLFGGWLFGVPVRPKQVSWASSGQTCSSILRTVVSLWVVDLGTSSGASPKRQLEEVLLPSKNTTDLVLFQPGQANVIFTPVPGQTVCSRLSCTDYLNLAEESGFKHPCMKEKSGRAGN